ncbi:hypothetical protein HAX54_030118 [Datura stramonium]|uniref:Protein kinase domain-containing protein n=1 Tax=Datura stramonium TaxID=4076 RepID=A0ABS8SAN7_DATST|nr:hypothetical protein [Datura stramonium]
MLQVREQVEQEIWRQQKQGHSHFWLDNWIGLGALCHVIGLDFVYDRTVVQVKEKVEAERWNEIKLKEIFPNEIEEHIIMRISPPIEQDKVDKPYWKPAESEKFTALRYVKGTQEHQVIIEIYSKLMEKIIEEKLADVETVIDDAIGKLHDGDLVNVDLTKSNMLMRSSANQLFLHTRNPQSSGRQRSTS